MTTPLDPPGPLAWLDDLATPSSAAAPRASDPVPFRGVPIPHPQAPAAGGGSFHVDRARAPEAIRELEDAKRLLEDLRSDATFLGRILPPSDDRVSWDAAAVLGASAIGGAGSLTEALDAGIARLAQLTQALRADLLEYGSAESTGSSRFDDRLA